MYMHLIGCAYVNVYVCVLFYLLLANDVLRYLWVYDTVATFLTWGRSVGNHCGRIL